MESLNGPAQQRPANRFSELSASRQRLIRLCQATNFGSIENLEIRDSEPVFTPAPAVRRDIKLDDHERRRAEVSRGDFELVKEVQILMDRLDELGAATIRHIEVRAGIPRRIFIEDRELARRSYDR